MTASLKIQKLESKIMALQSQQQELLKQRLLGIAQHISRLNLAQMDDVKLVKGLLFLQDRIAKQDPALEGWQNAAEKFLRKPKNKTNPREAHPHNSKAQSALSPPESREIRHEKSEQFRAPSPHENYHPSWRPVIQIRHYGCL
jgi:hypothetical protein